MGVALVPAPWAGSSSACSVAWPAVSRRQGARRPIVVGFTGSPCPSGPAGPGAAPTGPFITGTSPGALITGAAGGRAGRADVHGRLQLVGDAGDDNAGLHQQPGLQPQGALVVQQLLPPVTQHVFGNVQGHD